MSSTPPDPRPVLVADIGGTHARAGLVTQPGQAPAQAFRRPTRSFRGLAEFLAAARAQLTHDAPPVRAVCAVASPADDDPVELTNAGWRFSPAQVARELGLERVTLLNDWVAQGWAVTALGAADQRVIHAGTARADAPRLALGPGTGLGGALITPGSAGWRVFPSEGGHMSFAPQTPRQQAIADNIQQRFGHCSAERLASGLGIEAIHHAIQCIDGREITPSTAEAIARAGLEGDVVGREVLAHMSEALGNAAGDWALATGARGGVYIGGGVIPALGAAFDWQRFHRAFLAKGRFRRYLEAIPIIAVTHPQAGLLGLSAYLRAAG
jgi:glucokinase